MVSGGPNQGLEEVTRPGNGTIYVDSGTDDIVMPVTLQAEAVLLASMTLHTLARKTCSYICVNGESFLDDNDLDATDAMGVLDGDGFTGGLSQIGMLPEFSLNTEFYTLDPWGNSYQWLGDSSSPTNSFRSMGPDSSSGTIAGDTVDDIIVAARTTFLECACGSSPPLIPPPPPGPETYPQHMNYIPGQNRYNIQGTQGNDVFYDVYSHDVTDWYNLKKGDDYADGGKGDDEISGGQGDDTLIGGEGDDQIWGDQDNDELWGEEGDDQIWGGDGDDLMVGGLGNDQLDGGDGYDSAFFAGVLADYTITCDGINAGALSVPDGSDLLYNIEELVFTDQTTSFCQ